MTIRQEIHFLYPTFTAAELGYKDIVELLLAFGADMSLTEKGGRTPLYIAARGGHTDIVDMLIRAERQQKLDGGEVHDSVSLQRRLSVTSADSHDISTEQVVHDLEEGLATQMQDIITLLSKYLLDAYDWLKLAHIWDFEEEHILAIEHHYTGKLSYREHTSRLMNIWFHSLPSNKHPLRELCISLSMIGKGRLASCIMSKSSTPNTFWLKHYRLLKAFSGCTNDRICSKLCIIL